jgi:hypothetical protein
MLPHTVSRERYAGRPPVPGAVPRRAFPEPIPGHPSGRRIYVLIVLSFTALVCVTWISEYFDPVNLLLTGKQSAPNPAEAWAESVWILLVMLLLLVASRTVLMRLRYLEGLLHMCSFCKGISVDSKWVPFEQYLQQYSKLVLSHSLCPDCACKHYGYSKAEQEADALRENAQRLMAERREE